MDAPVRLLNAVAGGELTGLSLHENVGGHAHGLTNMQHVGDFGPGENAALKEAMAMIRARRDDRQQSPLGYITGLPTMSSLTNRAPRSSTEDEGRVRRPALFSGRRALTRRGAGEPPAPSQPHPHHPGDDQGSGPRAG